jgi:CelD/BcsL family acetyltransferase involved in cellulose biosynthesis
VGRGNENQDRNRMVSVQARAPDDRAREVATTGIDVEILRGTEGLRKLREEWRKLYARASLPEHVFLSEPWISLWQSHYLPAQDDDKLILVACREHGHLALIWPLVEVHRLGLKLLKWAGEPVSQYGDVLVGHSHRRVDLLDAAWQGILSLGADALVLRKTRTCSVASAFLKRKNVFVSEHDRAPFIDLSGITCPKAQAERYSAKDRKNRRRHRKRLSELGPVAFRWLEPSAEAGALAHLAVLLKRDWLKQRGRISKAFTDRRIEAFLESALSGDNAGLDGRVGVITVAEKPAALLVGFLNKGYYAGFLTAYDAAYERHGPGSLLFEDAIAAAIGEGLSCIDLLAPADSYKSDWTGAWVEIEDLCLPLTIAGRIYTRVVQARLRQGLKTGIEALPPRVRRAILIVAAIIPAELYSSTEI